MSEANYMVCPNPECESQDIADEGPGLTCSECGTFVRELDEDDEDAYDNEGSLDHLNEEDGEDDENED